jgi:hypothetical protein
MAKISIIGEMIDITEPVNEVEVMYSSGNLWINIDGICRLRCTRIRPELMTWNIDKEAPMRGLKGEA